MSWPAVLIFFAAWFIAAGMVGFVAFRAGRTLNRAPRMPPHDRDHRRI